MEYNEDIIKQLILRLDSNIKSIEIFNINLINGKFASGDKYDLLEISFIIAILKAVF